ncbi:MAG: ABC transporter ATP-binding protein [Bacteroidia bacterium]|nr:ABC transporter ATP-binding protein [Bacteroidia bacterium]MDW8345506.1 ABC transporter ATP-binding protein [Bacteroidia bacterium]
MSVIIKVEHITKQFKQLLAVSDVSFEVHKGEIFGLLGPNGAGKTTTLEIIEMLQKADKGEVFIAGMNIKTHAQEIKKCIGVQFQTTSLYDKITVRECIILFAHYYPHAVSVDTLLDWVSLQEKAKTFIKHLSGGQKQRLVLALALVNNPDIIFLDEPTTGLDPQARRNIWDIIQNLKKMGKTIMLTTHYMDEAERLCDRLAIMDNGRIITIGKPHDLIRQANLPTILTIENTNIPKEIIQNTYFEQIDGKYIFKTQNVNATLQYLLTQNEMDLNDISIQKPTLEDLFIYLTGKTLRE